MAFQTYFIVGGCVVIDTFKAYLTTKVRTYCEEIILIKFGGLVDYLH